VDRRSQLLEYTQDNVRELGASHIKSMLKWGSSCRNVSATRWRSARLIGRPTFFLLYIYTCWYISKMCVVLPSFLYMSTCVFSLY
jgi:hypothetical protein